MVIDKASKAASDMYLHVYQFLYFQGSVNGSVDDDNEAVSSSSDFHQCCHKYLIG